MSTIYIGMHDRRARFHHERQKDDAPYVPLHELNAALEANRSLVRQLSERKPDREFGWVDVAFVAAGVVIGQILSGIIL